MRHEEGQQERFAAHLLAWYAQEGRHLPWREQITPYRTWVSEIMLQQTRVEAVIPYFERFIHTYPTLSALAEAEDDQLHKLWEGLGYYSRVRNMKKCAQVCVERYDGELPRTRDELLKLRASGHIRPAPLRRSPVMSASARWTAMCCGSFPGCCAARRISPQRVPASISSRA